MVWAVSLLTTKLSPRCLTDRLPLVAFAVCMGVVTSTWPLAHTALYLHEIFSGRCTSIHFGENQLSPRSISISPLSTAHPPVLQHWWVRASTDCHIRFTLAMDSSRGFGSHRRNCSPCSDSVALWLPGFTAGYPRYVRCTRRIILQKARH
jgi:hypothetical protein